MLCGVEVLCELGVHCVELGISGVVVICAELGCAL